MNWRKGMREPTLDPSPRDLKSKLTKATTLPNFHKWGPHSQLPPVKNLPPSTEQTQTVQIGSRSRPTLIDQLPSVTNVHWGENTHRPSTHQIQLKIACICQNTVARRRGPSGLPEKSINQTKISWTKRIVKVTQRPISIESGQTVQILVTCMLRCLRLYKTVSNLGMKLKDIPCDALTSIKILNKLNVCRATSNKVSTSLFCLQIGKLVVQGFPFFVTTQLLNFPVCWRPTNFDRTTSRSHICPEHFPEITMRLRKRNGQAVSAPVQQSSGLTNKCPTITKDGNMVKCTHSNCGRKQLPTKDPLLPWHQAPDLPASMTAPAETLKFACRGWRQDPSVKTATWSSLFRRGTPSTWIASKAPWKIRTCSISGNNPWETLKAGKDLNTPCMFHLTRRSSVPMHSRNRWTLLSWGHPHSGHSFEPTKWALASQVIWALTIDCLTRPASDWSSPRKWRRFKLSNVQSSSNPLRCEQLSATLSNQVDLSTRLTCTNDVFSISNFRPYASEKVPSPLDSHPRPSSCLSILLVTPLYLPGPPSHRSGDIRLHSGTEWASCLHNRILSIKTSNSGSIGSTVSMLPTSQETPKHWNRKNQC